MAEQLLDGKDGSMQGKDFADRRNGSDMWHGDGDGDTSDFLNMENSNSGNGQGDSEFLLLNPNFNFSESTGDMDYNPMGGDMVNSILVDPNPTEFTSATLQNNSSWPNMDSLPGMLDPGGNGFLNSKSDSPESSPNENATEWATATSTATATPTPTPTSNGPVQAAPTAGAKEPRKQGHEAAQSPVASERAGSHASPSPSPSLKRKRGGATPALVQSPSVSHGRSKQSVPTAKCRMCKKETPTNGANFKRHEEACMRQRGIVLPPETPPSGATKEESSLPSGPVSVDPKVNGIAPHGGMGVPPLDAAEPAAYGFGNGAPDDQRRIDGDLTQRIRRIEGMIATIDMSSRVLLRDSLKSLSNKADPNCPRTPEQEEFNRAAEHLVLRMLFS